MSPEESVPKGNDGGGVKGTDEYEQQKVETHHDGKMVPEEPGGAAGMSEEGKHYIYLLFTSSNQNVLIHCVTLFTEVYCTMVSV